MPNYLQTVGLELEELERRLYADGELMRHPGTATLLRQLGHLVDAGVDEAYETALDDVCAMQSAEFHAAQKLIEKVLSTLEDDHADARVVDALRDVLEQLHEEADRQFPLVRSCLASPESTSVVEASQDLFDQEQRLLQSSPWFERDEVLRQVSEAVASGRHDRLAAVLEPLVRRQGVQAVAQRAGLTRQGLAKVLQPNARPGFATVIALLTSLGLSVEVNRSK